MAFLYKSLVRVEDEESPKENPKEQADSVNVADEASAEHNNSTEILPVFRTLGQEKDPGVGQNTDGGQNAWGI